MRYIFLATASSFALILSAHLAFVKEGESSDRGNTLLASKNAEYLLRHEEYQEARSMLEEALRTNPSNPALYALLGEACRGLGDDDGAMDAYTQAIRHNTREPMIFCLRGCLHAKRKDWVHAIQDYTKAIHLDPDVPISYYQRGKAYFSQRKYAKAREDYEGAWKRGLESPTAYALAYLLSMCPLASLRDGRLAVKYAKLAYEQKQNTEASCLAILAAAHAEAGEWDEAVRHCELAIHSAKGSFRDLLSMCLELYRLHEPYHEGPSQSSGDSNTSSLWVLSPTGNNVSEIMDAIKAASSGKVIKPNPQLAEVHIRLGEYFRYSDTVDAILHYNRGIELDPKNSHGFVGRSMAYSILGKGQEAMADAKAALAISPEHLNARFVFAWCLACVGELDKAICETNKLCEEFSDHPLLYLLRGHCDLAQGHFDKAVGELTEAIERNPKFTIAYAERAVALSALGKKDEANRALDECGRPSPSLRELTEVRIKALDKGQPGRTK